MDTEQVNHEYQQKLLGLMGSCWYFAQKDKTLTSLGGICRLGAGLDCMVDIYFSNSIKLLKQPF